MIYIAILSHIQSTQNIVRRDDKMQKFKFIKSQEKDGIQVKKHMKHAMVILMAVAVTIIYVIPANYIQAATKTVKVKTVSGNLSVSTGTSVNVNGTKSTVPTLSIVSNNIFGTATTSGHTTIKAELGTKVEYTGKAILKLNMPGSINNSLIDSSKATVSLGDGDGYSSSDFKFNATKLIGKWSKGKLTYALKEGDIECNNDGYFVDNGGREWSCLGGDGGGNYYFNLTVSGITYNGKLVPSQTFRVHVYIYGRDFSA